MIASRKIRSSASLLSAFLLTGVSQTSLASEIDMKVSGFASFYGSTALSDKEEGESQEGISEETDLRSWNKFGLRLDVDLQENLKFGAQVLAKGQETGEPGTSAYDPEFDWIYASYQFTDGLSLSAGRMRLPLFMYSEYIDVGYAYQWVTAPSTVYGNPSFNAYEGLQLLWSTDMGNEWYSDVQIWAGNSEEYEETLEDIILLDNLAGISWQVEHEWLSLRAVYMLAKVTASVELLDPIVQRINSNIGALVSGYDFKTTDVYGDDWVMDAEDGHFFGFGAMLDFDTFFFDAEVTHIDVDDQALLGELNSYYASAGLRLPGMVTLSLTYGVDEDNYNEDAYDAFYDYLISFAGSSADTEALATGVDSGLQIAQVYEVASYNFTARWDFHPKAAMKLEYMQQELQISDQDPTKPETLRLGLDLIF